MNETVANSLLKVLEEPGPSGLFYFNNGRFTVDSSYHQVQMSGAKI
jgi:hypothetical protein